jgi:spermidine/putrescine transport system ATP-binding protein
MEADAVELINVSKRFQGSAESYTLNQLNLTIQDGEFFSLLGPSGCGKTTTLRMIAGFDTPTDGEIYIHGERMQNQPPFHRPVNTVFQNYALFPHLNVLQNVAFGLEMENLPHSQVRRRVLDMLALVQLNGLESRYPRQLSGGQQQRVALARALVKHPRVLLLDEPLGALDLKLRKEMQLELKHMQRQVGITFIYVTHDQEEAMTMSDRIGVMYKGNLLQVGSPFEIYEHPATRFVADFIGESNFLTGEVTQQRQGAVEVLVDDQLSLQLPTLGSPVSTGSIVSLTIRPEKVRLRQVRNIEENGSLLNCCSGVIKEVIYVGMDTRYVVALTPQSQITVRSQNVHSMGSHHYDLGTEVQVMMQPDCLRIIAEDSNSVPRRQAVYST